jgi:hypothetical protein
VSESRALRPGKLTTIALEPKTCGFVTFETDPARTQYSLVSLGDGHLRREGATPLASPIVVPPGAYRLTIQERQCSQFTVDSLGVAAEQTTHVQKTRIRLVCGAR